MKSKTKIEKQLSGKTNPLLVETIVLAKKHPKWLEVAHILTTSRRNRREFNLGEIEKHEKDCVVPGKVLSGGEIVKKKKVVALGFSGKAEEKLKKVGCEVVLIKDEIKKNKEMKGLEVLGK